MKNLSIQIFVKYNKSKVLLVNNNTLISDFKILVSNKINIPIPYFFMISGSKVLDDTSKDKLYKYNIKNNSTINIGIRPNSNRIII